MKKNLFEEAAEMPSRGLESIIRKAKSIHRTLANQSVVHLTNRYMKQLGPGLVSGAADDDPSGIATYSQTGAQYGFSLLWLSAWTLPLMATIQEMCARIALVTGRGLASNIRRTYPKKVLYLCTGLLFFANTLNIGADLGAMAKGVQLIFPTIGYVFLIVGIGVGCLLLQIFVTYQKYARYLKWLAVTLFAYIATGLIIHMDWGVLLHRAFIPTLSLSKDEILLVMAILGTTISPYLFFWQTSQEVEEEIAHGQTTIAARQGTTKTDIKKMRFDVWSGMFLSNLVMFFIIAVCGATLFAHGVTNIQTASDAAEALKPLAGPGAYLLFALGIIGTGMLAIPVLAGSTAYAMSESFGWKEGLYRKLHEARAFYGVIILSVLVGIGINFLGIDPIKALIYSAIANGLAAPVILICIVRISSSKKVMGEHTNSKARAAIGWIITGLMSVAALVTVVTFFL